MKLQTYWVCVAHRFAVPAVECGARGDVYTAGDKHCKDTGHPIVTTTVRDLADRLAYRPDGTADLCSWCAAEKHEKCRGADSCGCTCNERSAA